MLVGWKLCNNLGVATIQLHTAIHKHFYRHFYRQFKFKLFYREQVGVEIICHNQEEIKNKKAAK